jgi:hypothetical protein
LHVFHLDVKSRSCIVHVAMRPTCMLLLLGRHRASADVPACMCVGSEGGEWFPCAVLRHGPHVGAGNVGAGDRLQARRVTSGQRGPRVGAQNGAKKWTAGTSFRTLVFVSRRSGANTTEPRNVSSVFFHAVLVREA